MTSSFRAGSVSDGSFTAAHPSGSEILEHSHKGTPMIAALVSHNGRLMRCLLLWWLTVAVGCAGGGEGPGHRSQRLALTPEQEYELGSRAYQEILKKYQVVQGGPQVKRVRQVGWKIV